MIFSSKTPRDLSHDPEPWLFRGMIRHAGRKGNLKPEAYAYAPRPQFDHVQHNAPNPILTSLRKRLQYQRDVGNPSTAPRIAATMLRTVETFQQHGVMSATPGEIDHARRILTRLANLSQIGD